MQCRIRVDSNNSVNQVSKNRASLPPFSLKTILGNRIGDAQNHFIEKVSEFQVTGALGRRAAKSDGSD